ncbi:MAG: aconitate hydratase AcnA [Phycisphaerae bacterium]|nr:aconitate hydratase AcnA [Phycisphaerae bacterium]
MSADRSLDPFSAIATLSAAAGSLRIWRLDRLDVLGRIDRLPYSIRILLENALRNLDGYVVTEDHVRALAGWDPKAPSGKEIPFLPARVVLQDFTGVPCMVDLAAMRSAVVRLGGDAKQINPLVPVDLVIDHSVQVDEFGRPDALELNARIEFERNRERYEFLRWGQQALANVRIVPPATGIVHQVNLEYLAKVVMVRPASGATPAMALPDTLVGTDSHTTMINGLGVLGWGVGGIEAEANMLGQPIYMLIPEVVGFKLTGRLREGATATDLVLTVTQMLRTKGVVGKFVEFFGPGLSAMSLPDRATIANMAPEYGATMGFFPVDDETLAYLRRTGRANDEVDLVERYCKEQGLFRTATTPDPSFNDTVELDLASVEPSLAGPKRPQDRVSLGEVKANFRRSLTAPTSERGFALAPDAVSRTVEVRRNGDRATIGHGAVVIAAITSCTNTSNPSVMLAAGLVAKKAVERGLKVRPYVKTSLAPGSRVVTEYLSASGLTPWLEKLGFHTVGYGCTTCIGNSGPLPDFVSQALSATDLVVSAVLSGNRNFEGRVHPQVKANYLASPPLVVAYAIAGTVDIDLTTEPIGTDTSGRAVLLREIWPTTQEVQAAAERFVTPEMFRAKYADVLTGNPQWNSIKVGTGDVYSWDSKSTYIQEPPFFQNLAPQPRHVEEIRKARVLVMVGDSVTTDHISPAGSIKPDSPAGRYLQEHGVRPADFNSYGARRGNDRVMTRGTFANIRLRNLLAPGTEGGVTLHLPDGAPMPIYDAAMKYQAENVPLIILAGAEYGTGSSRDWAAKGTMLLGVRAVIAVSFERIHRSNLVGMGVLPLEFQPGKTRESIGLTGQETFDILGLSDDLRPGQLLRVVAKDVLGRRKEFSVHCRIDTPIEVEYYRHGGILPMVLRQLMRKD